MRNIIGVDVSKDTLDAFSLPDGTHSRFGNDRRGIAKLLKWTNNNDQCLVVFEATGAYHHLLEEILGERGTPFNKVNPRHARGSPSPPASSAKPTVSTPPCSPLWGRP